MREILFRGKSVNDGRWLCGDLSNYGNYKTIAVVKGFSVIDSCEVCPETIGQYTGITDKNGVKIFEGDVIRIEFQQDFYVGKICWCDGLLGWVVKFLDGTTPETMELINFYNTKYVEVIGNIHDNPELMGGEANG